MRELGLLEEFLKLPHEEIHEMVAVINGITLTIADLSHVPAKCKFIAMMPQWHFLNFLAEKAREYPDFKLLMETTATELVESDGRMTGVRAQSGGGELVVNADLVVAADGRYSEMRKQAGFEVMELAAPIDVLWMRFSFRPGDPHATGGRIYPGHILAMLNRGDYWQCASVVPKGGYEKLRAAGIKAFQEEIVKVAPFLQGRMNEIDDWEKIKLLTVLVNRLRQWARPGLLCIGDAAHAMSPIGGVGINLAIQDAVATANLLAGPLRQGAPSLVELQAVQRRREWPTKMTQRLQVAAQNNIMAPILAGTTRPSGLAFPMRMLKRFPVLRRIPARLVGIGFRPEHVAGFLRQAA